MTFDEFLSRFEGNVNEENFGSQEQRDALYEKYDQITDELSVYAKNIGEDVMATKADFEAQLEKCC